MPAPLDYRVATLAEHVGHDFGASPPALLDQSRISLFAECTGDRQWIHVDVDRARRESPFGTTIAHGALVLSMMLGAHFELGVYPRDAAQVLNYGFDRVRFLAPVPAGSAVAVRVELKGVEPKGDGRWLVRLANSAHAVAEPQRPVLVVDSLAMVLA
jgi:acyl dehydratase